MDFLKVNDPSIHNIVAEKFEFPDYVSEQHMSKQSSVFLHEDNYPIGSKGETWLSYAYAYAQNDAKALKDLNKAAQYWGIEEDIKKITETPLVKKASESFDKYAMIVEMEDGRMKKLFPINDEYEIRKSAHDLANNKINLPIEYFVETACTIVKEAKANNIELKELPYSVVKFGEDKMFDPDMFVKIADERIALLENEEHKEDYRELQKLAHIIENHKDLLETCCEFDRDFNFDKSYGKSIHDPYAAVYSGMEVDLFTKIANQNSVLGEHLIPVEALLKVAKEEIKVCFDEEFMNKYASAKNGKDFTRLFNTLNSRGVETLRKLVLKNN